LGAIAIAACDWRGTLARFLAVLCFLTGIILTEFIARALAILPSWSLLSSAIGIEMVLIVVAYFALVSHGTARIESFAVCMSLGLGLQNGAFRRTGGINVHTTFLTGMITGLIATHTETYLSGAALHAKTSADPKSHLLYGIWAAFVLGAATGAAIAFNFGAFAVLGAAVLLFAIILRNLMVLALDAPR
jgi:uncharacterized membrane protein YoaK (UPF0700 family)